MPLKTRLIRRRRNRNVKLKRRRRGKRKRRRKLPRKKRRRRRKSKDRLLLTILPNLSRSKLHALSATKSCQSPSPFNPVITDSAEDASPNSSITKKIPASSVEKKLQLL
jgi:hypothetical protein